VRKNITLCLLAFALVVITRVTASAQEYTSRNLGTLEGQFHESSEEQEVDESEKPAVQKPDSVFISKQSSSKAKSNSDPSKPATKKNDEDAVSFNFLYYIIQRFKSTDIIED
jgi:hypothetical protein